MTSDGASKRINVAIAGLGNCAASFIEGLCFYRQYPDINTGLLFPALCGYSVRDIEVVTAFDISLTKVGLPMSEAIYQSPNNFVRLQDLHVDGRARVFRGPTLDGNPEHLARFVEESPLEEEDVVSILKDHHVDVLVNLLRGQWLGRNSGRWLAGRLCTASPSRWSSARIRSWFSHRVPPGSDHPAHSSSTAIYCLVRYRWHFAQLLHRANLRCRPGCYHA